MSENKLVFNEKPGRPVKYASIEEKKQAILESKRKWREANKERYLQYGKMYYKKTHVNIKEQKKQNINSKPTIANNVDLIKNKEIINKMEIIIKNNEETLKAFKLKNNKTINIFKPSLILMRGPLKEEKMTYAKITYPNYEYVSADDYFIVNGERNFDPKKIGEANQWCKNKAIDLLKKNKNVIVMNTFKTLWELDNYISECDKLCNIEILKLTSQYENLHTTSKSIIDKYYKEYQEKTDEKSVYLNIKTQ